MIAKYFQWCTYTFNGDGGLVVGDGMYRHSIWLIIKIIPLVLFHQLFQNRIPFVVDQDAAGFNLMNKNAELIEVVFKRGKHIDMIPGNAGEHGNMRKQEMKFGSLFNSGCRVFIAFAHNYG